jgi:monoterpene epsilon-lactone hydrolase
MVMADRPEVRTAAAPVVAIDTVLLAQQMVAALARLPFRSPFRGNSSRLANFGASVTREVVRSFMGYCSSLPIAEFRSIELLLDDLCKVVMPPIVHARDVDGTQTTIGGVPGILYVPRGSDPQGVALYLHGGGYIGTSPTMYAFFTSRICARTRCAVFVADYRLAPEFPFPAGLVDAARVLAALVAAGVPPERLFVAGDSGGGGLATSLVVAAPEDVHLVRPAGMILFSPEVDLRLDEPSVTDNAESDILPWNIPTASYLHGFDASSGYVSAVDADLEGFPPTAVSWGGDEMFRDPIRRFVERLEQAGVPTHAHEVPGMFHVFQILMPWADESRSIYDHVAGFVNGLVADAPPLAPGVIDSLLSR